MSKFIKHRLSVFVAVLYCLHSYHHHAEAQSTTVRPYQFGFTIDEQQHRFEKRDERGIVMGEFGFITADGIYHVTVYATDEEGRFRILAMKNYPYSSKPKTFDIMMTPKKTPTTTTTTTTTVKPTLPRQKFYNEACSGCFLSNGNNKAEIPDDNAEKTGIRTLSKPLASPGTGKAKTPSVSTNSATQPKLDVRGGFDTAVNQPKNSGTGKTGTATHTTQHTQLNDHKAIPNPLQKTQPLTQHTPTTTVNIGDKNTKLNPVTTSTVSTSKISPKMPNRIVPSEKLQQHQTPPTDTIDQSTITENPFEVLRRTVPSAQTARTATMAQRVVAAVQANKNPLIYGDIKSQSNLVPSQTKIPKDRSEIPTRTVPSSGMEQHSTPHTATMAQRVVAAVQATKNQDIYGDTNTHSNYVTSKTTIPKSSSAIPTRTVPSAGSQQNPTPRTGTSAQRVVASVKSNKNQDNYGHTNTQARHNTSPYSSTAIQNSITPSDNSEDSETIVFVTTPMNKQTSEFVTTAINKHTSEYKKLTPQQHIQSPNQSRGFTQQTSPKLSTNTYKSPATTNTMSPRIAGSSPGYKHFPSDTQPQSTNTGNSTPNSTKLIPKTHKQDSFGNTGFPSTQTQTQALSNFPQDTFNKASGLPKKPTMQPNVMDVIVNKVLPSVMGSKGVVAKTPTGNSPSGRIPANSLTPIGKSGNVNPTYGKANSNPQYKLSAVASGGTGGAAAGGGDGDLYRFKYILDYHGHTETGKRNGNKEGNYYAIGDDDIERTIEYVANENGYQPRIRWRKLNNPVQSKENTLKDYEFVWFKLN